LTYWNQKVDYKDDPDWQDWNRRGMHVLLNKIKTKKMESDLDPYKQIENMKVKGSEVLLLGNTEGAIKIQSDQTRIIDQVPDEMKMELKTENIDVDDFSSFCSLDGGSEWKWNNKPGNEVMVREDERLGSSVICFTHLSLNL
jgi:hypothetical protein